MICEPSCCTCHEQKDNSNWDSSKCPECGTSSKPDYSCEGSEGSEVMLLFIFFSFIFPIPFLVIADQLGLSDPGILILTIALILLGFIIACIIINRLKIFNPLK